MNNFQDYSDSQLQQLHKAVKHELARRLRQRRQTAIECLLTMISEFDKEGVGPPEILLDGLSKRI